VAPFIWIRELLKEAGKAKTDFLELLALFPGHTSATKAMASVNELLEYGLLTKARSLKKEVDEVGSAQNEVWTVQKYQESISCYDQVLMMNSNNVAASEEKARVKEACRDLYISEAHIERTMAKNVLKERETEKELKRQIAIEKELGGREHLANLGQLEKNLRNVERRYPSSDPEKAVEHWENANDDYKIALGCSSREAGIGGEPFETSAGDEAFRGRGDSCSRVGREKDLGSFVYASGGALYWVGRGEEG